MKKKQLILLILMLLILPLVNAEDENLNVELDSVLSLDSMNILINQSFQIVKPILEYSCYDCHSNKVNKSWYFSIPGLNSWLNGHIEEGQEHLDFSNGFPFTGKEGSPYKLLEEIKEEIEEDEMPLFSYRIMHWGRLIEGTKRDSLFIWIDQSREMLKAHYPSSGDEPEEEH